METHYPFTEGMHAMEFLLIIEKLLEMFGPLIADCIDTDKARRFGPAARLMVYRAGVALAEDEGLRGREKRHAGLKAVDVVREEIEGASDDELCVFCESLK